MLLLTLLKIRSEVFDCALSSSSITLSCIACCSARFLGGASNMRWIYANSKFEFPLSQFVRFPIVCQNHNLTKGKVTNPIVTSVNTVIVSLAEVNFLSFHTIKQNIQALSLPNLFLSTPLPFGIETMSSFAYEFSSD